MSEPRYGVGQVERDGTTFWCGPFLHEEEALDCYGMDDMSVIVELHRGELLNKILWHWSKDRSRWEKPTGWYWWYHPESDCVFVDREGEGMAECNLMGPCQSGTLEEGRAWCKTYHISEVLVTPLAFEAMRKESGANGAPASP